MSAHIRPVLFGLFIVIVLGEVAIAIVQRAYVILVPDLVGMAEANPLIAFAAIMVLTLLAVAVLRSSP